VFIIEVEENSTSENTASEIYCNLQVDSNLIVLTFVEIWTKAPSPSKNTTSVIAHYIMISVSISL
jgi:hypothetical protein